MWLLSPFERAEGLSGPLAQQQWPCRHAEGPLLASDGLLIHSETPGEQAGLTWLLLSPQALVPSHGDTDGVLPGAERLGDGGPARVPELPVARALRQPREVTAAGLASSALAFTSSG